jgi:hypothetical protein
MYAHQERIEANMDAWCEGNKACLERKEPASVEIANVAVHLKDFNGATCKETVWATDSLSKDRCLAVRSRLQLKKQTQRVGGSWRKLVAAVRSLPRCYKRNS